MPKIISFLYTEDSVQDRQSQSLKLINPRIVFKFQFIPTNFSFAFTYGIIGLSIDVEHTCHIRFKHEKSKKYLLDFEEIVAWPPDVDKEIPIEHQGMVITMNVRNVPIEVEGVHLTEIFVDGESMGSFPILFKVLAKE